MLKRTITGIAGIFTLAVLLITPVETKAADANSKTLTVVPPSFELYANPGETVSEKIRVRNESATDTSSYQIVVEDFKAVGEDGGVGLIDNQSDSTYSLAKWVFAEPKNFSVGPGEEKEIPFKVVVPKNAEPGGHYGSILVKIAGGQVAGGGASVASRVASLILLRVSGNVKEEASISSFKSDKSYYEKGPVNLLLRVKDTGNNHIKPKGTIVITNIFGQKVEEIDLQGLNVLPGAIRKMNTEWKPKGLLASRYTATVVARYGQNDAKTLTASTSFIIFPKYLIAVSVVILLIILFAATNRKKVKKFIHNLTK